MNTILRHTTKIFTRWVLFAALLAVPFAAHCEAVRATVSQPRIRELGAQDGGIPLLVPLLAQAAPDQAIDTFLSFLSKVFLIIGAISICYGGYEIARGRLQEGLLAISGGLVVAIAVPTARWLMKVGAGGP